jgi:hypothetical protein
MPRTGSRRHSDAAPARPAVAVYGRSGGLAIYELLGLAEEAKTATPEWVRTYEAGLRAYKDRRWSEAIGFFEATAAIRSTVDQPSEILMVLEAQHGEQWAAEDRELDARLAALRQKYGAPPNSTRPVDAYRLK